MTISSIFLPVMLLLSFFSDSPTLYQPLLQSATQAIDEAGLIPEVRQEELRGLASIILEETEDETGLLFVCTHNSRRSQMAQAWATAAAQYYGVAQLTFFSGGTEATAFNPRAVRALQEAGFQIGDLPEEDESGNTRYTVETGEQLPKATYFSKKYGHSANPDSNFVAIMVCSDADEACPVVDGAAARFALTYDDPKHFDGTPSEATKYTERSQQIAREMFFLMNLVKAGQE